MPFQAAPPVAAAEIASGTSFPTPAEEGDCFYRTDLNEFYVYDGTDWVRWEIETHESEHESGGADALPIVNQPQPGDDEKVYFGADDDYSLRYDSADDTYYIRDEVNATEVEIPKNVAMNLASHGARHEPGGADAADAYVEGESAGMREEHGSNSQAGPAAAGDGSWDTENSVSETISFATAFGSAPEVVTSLPNTNYGYELTSVITNTDTTGFDDVRHNFTTSGLTGSSPAMHWIAIGPS